MPTVQRSRAIHSHLTSPKSPALSDHPELSNDTRIGPDPRYLPAQTLSWTDTGADLVLYNRVGGTYHALNASASAIWRELNHQPTEREIVDAIVERFTAPRAEVSADVSFFLARASRTGLIETT